MGDAASLKLCVLGACKSGKTLLCRALSEQPIAAAEYQPTVAVRVQEVGNTINNEQVKVQLWDVSGSNKYQQYWETLAQDADGVVLVIDPSKPEQEKELEQFYVNFAQPNTLTTKQCMVLAVNAVQGDHGNVGGNWQGLRGKLGKLQSGEVTINYGGAAVTGVQEARDHFERLLKGCMARKRDKMERAVMGD